MTSIGEWAFSGCSSLTSVSIPEGVTSIGQYAFSGCSSLTSVSILEGVTSIGSYAFYGCSSLTSVGIPVSITLIGEWSFYNCSNIKTVYYGGFEAEWKNISIGSYNTYLNRAEFIYGRTHDCTLVHLPEKASTCTESGNHEYYCCPICKKASKDAEGTRPTTVKAETIPALGHSMEKHQETAATCTNLGNHTYYFCTICKTAFLDAAGKQKTTVKEQTVDALGHAMVLHEAKAPACDQPGNCKYYACRVCGKVYKDYQGTQATTVEAEYIPALGHTMVKTEAVAPTHTESGHNAYYTCSTCGKAYKDVQGLQETTAEDEILPAPGHTMVKTEAVAPTCEESGNNAYYTCSTCGKVYKDAQGLQETTAEDEILPALGHTMVKTEAVAPTCEESGHNAYYTCSTCNKVFKDAQGNQETTADAEILPALGHNIVPVEAKAPTCEEPGNNAYYTCSTCHKVFKDAQGNQETTADAEVLPALGHNIVPVEAKAPTCEEPGNNAYYTCSTCHKVFKDVQGNQETTVDAEILPALGHNIVKVEAKEPTYFETGNREYYVCTSCGKAWKDSNGQTETTPEAEQLPVLPSVNHGTNGTNVNWALTVDGTLIISGTGTFGEFWTIRDGITSVIIEPGITGIGSNAFSYCRNLTSISIPDSVTYIGQEAFSGCEKLTSVHIPEGVTSIGYETFYCCSSLASVNIPESVTSIGDYAFLRTSLTSISIPASVISIGRSAFYDCGSLTDITFAHRGTDRLSLAEDCFGISAAPIGGVPTTVCVPSVKTMNAAIRSYGWSDSGRSISFMGNTQFPMESIAITTQDGNTQYELGVNVTFKVDVEPADSTDDIAFSLVPEKTTAQAHISQSGVLTTLSVGTVTVRVQCVQNPELYAETTVEILPPTGTLTGLTVTTFNDYPGDAELGKPVQMIPVFTPANASERSVSWSVENGTGKATIDENGLLTPLAVGTVTVYAMAANGLEGGCTVNIVRYAEEITILLNGKQNLDRLSVGEGVDLSAVLRPEDTTTKAVDWSVIGETGNAELSTYDSYSYYRLTGITPGTVVLTATARDSKKVIASKRLTITDTLRSYSLPDGSGCLYYNAETGYITDADKTVRDVIIPAQIDGVTIVGIAPYAFANRNDIWGYTNDNGTLTSVSIPATVEEIGAYAFTRCTALTILRFAQGSRLKVIGESAFYNCEKLTSLVIPDSVETLGKNAISGLDALRNLTISGELNGIGWYSGLDTLTLTGSYVRGGTVIKGDGYTAYSTMPNAKKVILSESVKAVGDYAFSNCSNLKEVEIRGSLQSIGTGAFQDCYALTSINLPDSLQTIGKDCFKDCSDLQIIDVSKVPDVIVERETYLTGMAQIPEALIRATNGKTELQWDMYSMENGANTFVTKDYRTQEWYIYAAGTGKYYIYCEDTYTGARGSKEIEVRTGTVIRPADTGYLVSGGKLTLSAWVVPEERKVDADWYLAGDGQNYASISSSGVLTAKTVYAAQQVTVIAQPYDGSEQASKSIWILPKTTGLGLMLDGAPLGSTLNVEQSQTATLQLSAQTSPAGAMQDVLWSSGTESVARVDENGLVTLVKPGTAVIKATTKDGSKLTAQVTLNVTYIDASKKLTLTADAQPQIGLQPGQTVCLTLSGTEKIAPENVVFAVPSNQRDMGSVDENGVFTAGSVPGKVNVTAALKNDPLGRTASITISAIPSQAAKLVLKAVLPEGMGSLSEDAVIFDRAEMDTDVSFPVAIQAFDWQNNTLSGVAFRWSSSDTSVAAVDANGNVTVKAGARGDCAITAVAQDSMRVSGSIRICVRDYAPRMDTSGIVLNAALSAGTEVPLMESYDNFIRAVRVDDARFAVDYEDNLLTLRMAETVKSGNYKVTLSVTCDNGETYDYPITLKVTTTLPKLTVKQAEKLNTFYKYSQSVLTISGGEIVQAQLLDCDFTLEYEDGQWILRHADPEHVPAKPDTKGILSVLFAGYNTPVTNTLTVSTVATKPAVKMTSATGVLNTALSTDLTLNTTLTGLGEYEYTNVWTDTPGAAASFGGGVLSITLSEAKPTTVKVFVLSENWTQPMEMTYKVTVESKLPTLKPDSTTLKLNSFFTERTAYTPVRLSQGNLNLGGMTFTPSAKDGTAARTEADKLTIAYEPETETIAAWITNPGDAPKAGTYAFTYTAWLADDNMTALPGGSLKVTVAATAPQVKLSAGTVKLNQLLAEQELAEVKLTLTGLTDCRVADLEGMGDGMYFDADSGILAVMLPQGSSGGTYQLYPVIEDQTTMQSCTLTKALTLKVQAYSSDKLSVSLSAKGKLDTQKPEDAIVYTVTKVANCLGMPADVTLEGADAELFQAELETVDGKPAVRLMQLDGQTYATNRSYKLQFRFTVCGREVLSNVLTVKVTQTALKVTAPKNVTYYQSQSAPLRCVLTANAPIDTLSLSSSTAPDLLKALGGEENIFFDGTQVQLRLKNPGALQAGKSYTLAFEATPANNAENVKPITVKLTVKVMK